MPLYWKTKALLAKIETVYGTDVVPTGAANAILATDVSFSPMEGEDVSRNLERQAMGASPIYPTALRSQLTFSVEAVGSGTVAVAPGWGPLLRMCAVAQVITATVKVEYTPISTAHESGTIYFSVGGTRHVMTGCRGSAVLRFNAQGIPVFVFTITGLFGVPSEQAAPTPVYSAFQSPQVATKANTPTFTIGGAAMVLRDAEFDLGNDVQPRLLIGSESILIVDKAESFKATVEAVPVGTYNPYSIAAAQTTQAVQLIHGTVAGRKVQIDLPTATQGRVGAYSQQQNIVEWQLPFTPQPNAGDDQWKITLN